MDAQDFVALLKAQPFRPFRLSLSDGAQHEFWSPTGHFLVVRNEVYIGIAPDADGICDDYEIASLPHVTSVELI